MREEVIPLYAQAVISLNFDGEIKEVLIFDYLDPELYYFNLKRDKTKFEKEKMSLWKRMQGFIDKETAFLNGEEVFSVIEQVEIGFRGRKETPFILFLISTLAPLKEGENIYEVFYENETLDYDVFSIWFFPLRTEITEVISNLKHFTEKNFLIFHGRKGTELEGYEKICFNIKKEGFC